MPDGLWREVVDQILAEVQYAVLIMGKLREDRFATDDDVHRYFASFEEKEDQPAPPVAPDEGLIWEVKRLFGLTDLQKVILVMPPLAEDVARRRWTHYQELSAGRLPDFQGGEIAVTFDANGTPIVARIEKRGWFSKSYLRTDYAYEAVIKVEKR